jgi:hypothetical protein
MGLQPGPANQFDITGFLQPGEGDAIEAGDRHERFVVGSSRLLIEPGKISSQRSATSRSVHPPKRPWVPPLVGNDLQNCRNFPTRRKKDFY